MDDAERQLREIAKAREDGELEGMLEDEPQYVLVLHRALPNGTTGDIVQDPEVTRAIGRKTGLGDPTDTLGWGIWEVGTA